MSVTIRQMQKDVHELAKSKGWHSSPDMEELKKSWAFRIGDFCRDMNQASQENFNKLIEEILTCRFTSPEDKIPQMLINISGEVSEAWEEYRANHKGNETYFETDKQGNQKPLGIPTELADVVIRCMDTAEALGIDLEAAIVLKHQYNATRAYRHGGKKA